MFAGSSGAPRGLPERGGGNEGIIMRKDGPSAGTTTVMGPDTICTDEGEAENVTTGVNAARGSLYKLPRALMTIPAMTGRYGWPDQSLTSLIVSVRFRHSV